MIYKIEFIPHTDFSSIADNPDAGVDLADTMKANSQNGWEVFKIEETQKSNGMKGALVFYRK